MASFLSTHLKKENAHATAWAFLFLVTSYGFGRPKATHVASGWRLLAKAGSSLFYFPLTAPCEYDKMKAEAHHTLRRSYHVTKISVELEVLRHLCVLDRPARDRLLGQMDHHRLLTDKGQMHVQKRPVPHRKARRLHLLFL